MTRRMEFIFGGITLTLSEDDIEAVMKELAEKHPKREPTSAEFADACMERMKANARFTRTVIHN
jgi:hypothetical protein